MVHLKATESDRFPGAATCASPRQHSEALLRLQLVTIAWMVIECGVSLAEAKSARSPALLAFGSPTLQLNSTGPAVAWLQQALTGSDIAIEFAPYTGPIDGIFYTSTEAAVRALQTWAGIPADGIVSDNTWFTWMTPGSAQQLTLEAACGLLRNLPL